MKVILDGGAYVSRSIVSTDQRCVNLFIEVDEPGAEGSVFPSTHYPAPGLILLATAPDNAAWRCLFRAKATGDLYGVCGSSVYYISKTWVLQNLGSIASTTGMVSMCDNGFTILMVDGSSTGYTIDLVSRAFAVLVDPNFYGGTRVDTADTYFIMNRPNTNNFVISLTNQAAFGPLDIASKTSTPDRLQSVAVMGDNLWLFGNLTTEVWYNTGASDFTFGKIPGVFIEHGVCAQYSVAKYELNLYWLSQNEAGQTIVMRGNSLQAQRISTHAIEAEFGKYGDISDAIGFTVQMGGHAWYYLTFPGADNTWVWDESTKFWHERVSVDNNGVWHRHRANCVSFAYGRNVCGDFSNGQLYAFDFNTYNDAGLPIVYVRTLPHMMEEARLVTYRRFVADMEVGGGDSNLPMPLISLRWSDNRGTTFNDWVTMPMGTAGQYITSVQWWGLGTARDRVFELMWSANVRTALNGAWVDMIGLKA